MSELLWPIIFFAGGIVGGFAVGWTGAHKFSRCRVLKLIRGLTVLCDDIERSARCDCQSHRSSDITSKATLDGARDIRVCRPPLAKSDLPRGFWPTPKPPHPNIF
jgi:hypothetical protein